MGGTMRPCVSATFAWLVVAGAASALMIGAPVRAHAQDADPHERMETERSEAEKTTARREVRPAARPAAEHAPRYGRDLHEGQTEAGFEAAGGIGTKSLHSRRSHDLVFGAANYGWLFTNRLEVIGELWGGAQVNPTNRTVVGLTP